MVGEVETSIHPNAIIATFLVVLGVDWPLASLWNRLLCEGISVEYSTVWYILAMNRKVDYLFLWHDVVLWVNDGVLC